MSKVVVVGAGAWGTAMALQAMRAGCCVDLVARDPVTARRIAADRESRRLPGVLVPHAVAVTAEIDFDADLFVWAVPTQQLRASLGQFRRGRLPLLICAKGVEAGSGLLPLEVVAEVLGDCDRAVLSGPNFANEVARGLPAAAVIGASNAGMRNLVMDKLGCESFRLYGNADPTGVQLAGAAKNVIAIAAGAVIGGGLGENARAALVTRGLAELKRLIITQGGQADTAMGLSGVGDLMLTCSGRSSRNFSLGLALGSGKLLAEIQAASSTMVEGVATAEALVHRAQDVDLPICKAVSDLLRGAKTLEDVIRSLLSRPQRDE